MIHIIEDRRAPRASRYRLCVIGVNGIPTEVATGPTEEATRASAAAIFAAEPTREVIYDMRPRTLDRASWNGDWPSLTPEEYRERGREK